MLDTTLLRYERKAALLALRVARRPFRHTRRLIRAAQVPGGNASHDETARLIADIDRMQAQIVAPYEARYQSIKADFIEARRRQVVAAAVALVRKGVRSDG